MCYLFFLDIGLACVPPVLRVMPTSVARWASKQKGLIILFAPRDRTKQGVWRAECIEARQTTMRLRWREAITRRSWALSTTALYYYFEEWAIKNHPCTQIRAIKKDIATKSLGFSRLFCFLHFSYIVTRKRYYKTLTGF